MPNLVQKACGLQASDHLPAELGVHAVVESATADEVYERGLAGLHLLAVSIFRMGQDHGPCDVCHNDV
jgi:hypothetical protein